LAKLSFDAIINATPVGMNGEQEKPLLSEKELNCRYVFEMVYSPADTKFTKMARAKGIHVIPGVEMFVHQGARQFEIWTGKPAPWMKCFALLCMQWSSAHRLRKRVNVYLILFLILFGFRHQIFCQFRRTDNDARALDLLRLFREPNCARRSF